MRIKSVSVLLCCFLAAFLFVGCSKKEKAPEKEKEVVQEMNIKPDVEEKKPEPETPEVESLSLDDEATQEEELPELGGS